MTRTTTFQRSRGYTLIEILLATGLSLILLVTMIRIFQMTNEGFAESRILMDFLGRTRAAQQLLEADLSRFTTTMRPPRPVEAEDGYFSTGTVVSTITHNTTSAIHDRVYIGYSSGETKSNDTTTNYPCNYIALTVFNKDNPFRYVDPSNSSRILETPYAEVVWFVYQNNLYRVYCPFVPAPEEAATYANGSLSNTPYAFGGTRRIPTVRMISPGLLGDMRNRLMYVADGTAPFLWNYVSSDANLQNSIRDYLVLTDVIRFEVELWNPDAEQYQSFGELGNYFATSTGMMYRGQSVRATGSGPYYDTGSTISFENLGNNPTATELPTLSGMAITNRGLYARDGSYTTLPSSAFLPGIRVTVTAVDQDTGQVRKFHVSQDFRTR
ncbi:MAG: hypothetical protein Q4D38_09050 [Planctomycetia bacterium]|nr:hypothetical protein [Planctomycetia bacterium]